MEIVPYDNKDIEPVTCFSKKNIDTMMLNKKDNQIGCFGKVKNQVKKNGEIVNYDKILTQLI